MLQINKIYNADCLELMKDIPDNSIDLVLTDPPYGMNFKSGYRKIQYNNIENDNNLDWLNLWLKEISRIKKDNSHLYIFCSWHNIDIFKKEIELFFDVKNILIWHKNNTGMGDLFNDYAPQYEFIIYCNPNNKPLNNGRDSNIIKYARTNNELHPTQKPVALFEYLIKKSTNPNDLVLDCFSGSGTTAIACVNAKRNFICIEKDKGYYEASCRRLEEAKTLKEMEII